MLYVALGRSTYGRGLEGSMRLVPSARFLTEVKPA